jgi:hypothetical protein
MPKGIDDLLAGGGTPTVLNGLRFVSWLRGRLDELREQQPGGQPAPEGEPFPLDVLPAALRVFVEQVAAATATPMDFAGATLVAVTGAAVGNSRGIELIKNVWYEGGRFYLACVGHPGTGKSPAMRAVWRPLFALEKVREQQFKKAMRAYRKARKRLTDLQRQHPKDPEEQSLRLKAMSECEAVLTNRPRLKRTLTVDATMEALIPIMEKDPRGGLLLAQDELTGWVRGMDAYRGGRGRDRQHWLSCWAGEGLVNDRKTGTHGLPAIIERPFVCVVGGLPPDMLSTLADTRGRSDGFCDRLVFAFPRAHLGSRWTDSVVTGEARAAWQGALNKLYQLEADADEHGILRPVILEMHADARQAWIDWWNGHADEINDPDLPAVLLGPWSKLKAYAARLALVVHLLRLVCTETPDEQHIDLESMRRGLRLVSYFKSHARVVYDKITLKPEDHRAMAVLDWVRRKGEGECTARSLVTNKVAGIHKTSEATKVMKNLEDRGLGETVARTAANGRQVTYLVLRKEGRWDERDDS